VQFFTQKIMKIKCSFSFLKVFGSHFQIKIIINGSILNLRFVSMSELELSKMGLWFTSPILWNLQNI
jgi:hypothetical protein